MATWQLQEATDRFSEVIERALGEGPQVIAVRGEPVAVVISHAEHLRLTRPQTRFVEFMRSSPPLRHRPGYFSATGQIGRCTAARDLYCGW